jgi:RNA polymerase sigma-70 factor (ECF subfamily)
VKESPNTGQSPPVSLPIANAAMPSAPSVNPVGALYEDHAEFVWKTLQRFGVAESELEDALQEVFLVVHRRLDDYDPNRAKVTTWLFGIVARVAAGFRRRQNRRPLHLDEQASSLIASSLDPDQSLTLRVIQMALKALAPELSVTFLLFEIDQMSCTEIAELSNVPIGTVYSRLYLARKHLRKTLSRAGLHLPTEAR